jgi:hypothetical protein
VSEKTAIAALTYFHETMKQTLLGPATGVNGIMNPELLTDAEQDRERFMEAIGLTIHFLKMIGAEDSLTNKLMQLYAALFDLRRGAISPMLRTNKLDSAPPVRSEIWRARAAVAIALDYLVKSGLSPDAASQEVARLPVLKRLLKTNAKLKSSSLNWRTRLAEGSVENDVAKIRWSASREKLVESERNMTPSAFQDFLKLEGQRMLQVASNEAAVIPT